jgi:hypothetical protein
VIQLNLPYEIEIGFVMNLHHPLLFGRIVEAKVIDCVKIDGGIYFI